MGHRILAAGHALTVSDRDPAARSAAESDGAAPAASPRQAAAAGRVVITMLPDPRAIHDAAHGPDGVVAGLRPGTLWLEMSSSHPTTTRALAHAAGTRGAILLDAPVSGGVTGAESGTLTIMIGGAREVLARARPVLELLGRNLFHVGDQPGDGDFAKTINNQLSAANLTAAAEALALGTRGGLDPVRLVEALAAGSGSSHALTVKIPRYVLSGTFDAGFTIGQMLKDLDISQSLASELGVSAPVAGLVHSLWSSAGDEGHAGADHTEMVELLAAPDGPRLR
jgi:3-hydroxyisobutyrate dehydrogenase-like beta-hydroxyacid dehydrogenase